MLLLWCIGGCAVAWQHELQRASHQDPASANNAAGFFKFFMLTFVSGMSLVGCAFTSYSLWPRNWHRKSNAYFGLFAGFVCAPWTGALVAAWILGVLNPTSIAMLGAVVLNVIAPFPLMLVDEDTSFLCGRDSLCY